MLKIAICDDNQRELEHLYHLVNNYKLFHPSLEIELHSFASMETLYEQMDKLDKWSQYDLFLLDILTSGKMSGIDFARFIRSNGNQSAVIFISHSKDFALDAFSVDAVQYIVKPVGCEVLYTALDKAIVTMKLQTANSFAISTQNGIVNIYYHNVVYIECVKHFVHFHLSDNTIASTKTLRQSFSNYIEPIMEDERFIRTHHSYVINIQYIRKLNTHNFQLYGGHTIPIAKSKLGEVKNSYMNYIDKKTEI